MSPPDYKNITTHNNIPLCDCDVISFNGQGQFGHLTGAGGKKSFKSRLNDHDSDSVTEAKEKCKTNM